MEVNKYGLWWFRWIWRRKFPTNHKEELDRTEFHSSVGGGMVEVTMLGDRTLKSVKIKQEVVDPDDVEMLEDLVVSAVNDVIGQISRAEKEKLPSIPGMM